MIQDVKDHSVAPKPQGKPKEELPRRTLLVRYGKVGLVGQFRHNERSLPSVHTKVVVQTDRGLEMGEIISPAAAHRGCSCILPKEQIDDYVKKSGPDYPFSRNGRVMRMATVQDLNEQRHIEIDLVTKIKRCRDLIKQKNLPMKIVETEHLFGGDRVIYYFMADGRVDFRELVKELAREYNTRIEMRQVGARDEAKLVGDYDTCGRELCCKKFLKVLQPVSMRMAKTQRTSLDPSKISGRCGRLKCCLRYEDVGYRELEKRLPKYNRMVLSELGHGRVIDTLVLTQLVKIRLEGSGRIVAVNVEELLDKNYDPDDPKNIEARKTSEANAPKQQWQPKQQRGDNRQQDNRPKKDRPAQENPKPETKPEANATQTPESEEAPKKKRRRRRRRRKSSGEENPGGNSDNNNNPESAN